MSEKLSKDELLHELMQAFEMWRHVAWFDRDNHKDIADQAEDQIETLIKQYSQ